MSQNQQNTDRIDNYLFDQMSVSERQQFEEEIKNNEALAKAVAVQKMEQRTMQLLALKDVKANLETWKQEKNSTQTTNQKSTAKVVSMANRVRRRKRIFQFAAAAAIALIFGVFFGNQWVNENYSGEILAVNSFDKSSTTSGIRNPEEALDNFPVIYQPALAAMLNEDYEKAIPLLASIQDENYTETAQILQAECHFKLGNFENCMLICQDIIQNGKDDSNIEKAEWYLVLSYFAANQDIAANQLLNKILANENHAFYPYAVNLRADLSGFWGRWVN